MRIRRLPLTLRSSLRRLTRTRMFTRAQVRKGTGRLLFFVPALFLILFLVVYPVLQTIFLGFVSSEHGEFVGGDNYRDVLADPDTLNSRNLPWPPPLGTILHNALWIAIHLPISVFAGLWLALLLRDVKGASIVKSFIFLGMVTPMVVGGVVLRFLLESGVGIVPSFFGLIGIGSLDVNWMVRRELVLLGLIFGSIWLWTGFSLIVYSTGLTTIPKDYFEAARVDGTPPFRMFFRITFPLLKPMTLVVVVMTLLWELKIFDIVFAATGAAGGPAIGLGGGAADVLALQMYRYGFIAFDSGKAAAIASLLTLLTLLSTLVLLRRMVK